MATSLPYALPGTYGRPSIGVGRSSPLATPLLVALGFLLGGLPLSRFTFGALPIYFIDIVIFACIFLMWTGAVKKAPMKVHAHIPLLAFLYYIFFFGTWLREALEIQALVEPIYVLVRYSFSMFMVVLVPSLINDKRDLDLFLKAVLAGVTCSAIFAIMYALPQFGIVRLYLNQGSFLFPGRPRANVSNLMSVEADRAMSPIGGPNVTGSWFAAFWPLALLVWRAKPFGNKWATFAMGATFVLLAGALMTYGRATLISICLVCAAIIGFRLYKAWLTTLAILIGAAVFIAMVGIASSYFEFELVFFKFERMLNDPTVAHTDTARIYSYTTLIPFLEENPLWFITGMGVLSTQAVRLGVIDRSELILDLQLGEVHSEFASVFYKYGVIAMFINTALVLIAGIRAGKMGFNKSSPYQYYWQYMMVAFISLIPYWLFAHIYSTEENGTAFLFTLIGLVIALGKIDPTFRSKKVRRIRRVSYASQPSSSQHGSLPASF